MERLVKKILISILFLLSYSTALYSQSWSPPANVSDPAFPVNPTGLPVFGVDANGNAFAVWSSTESGMNVIRSSRFNASIDTWSSPELIGSANSADVHVATTTDGKALAVWTNDTPTSTVYANIFDGTSWTGEFILDTNPTYQIQFYPRVAVDTAGNAYVVWQVQGGNLARVIRSANYSFITNTWTSAVNISTDYGLGNEFLANATVSTNDSGAAVAVWVYQDAVSSIYKVQSNRFQSGSWLPAGSEETVAASSSDSIQFSFPQIAVAPNGNAICLWIQYDGTMSPTQSYVIASSVRNALSATWSSPLQVSSSGNADVSKVTIGVGCDSLGDAVAVWLLQDEVTLPNTAIVQGTTFPTLAWSGQIANVSDTALTALLPSIAVDGSGDAYATWTSSDEATFFVIDVAKYTKSSNSWAAPITVSDSGLITVSPNQISAIATNSAGDFFASWFTINNSPSEIILQASHISEATPPIAPKAPKKFKGKIKRVHPHHHKHFLLKTKWKASPSSDVVYYQIYKKYHKVKKIKATHHLVFKKRIYSRGSAKHYRIAAFNADNLRSKKKRLKIEHH